ncbi:MAG: hypothetical protein O2799_00885 [Planctomycetota bacterium]|nr:hypothetical protein [Planctomycetota bacterium]
MPSALEHPQPVEARALQLLAALEARQDPSPPSIRQALSLADQLTPSTEAVWLGAGLDKWVSDHRDAAAMARAHSRAAGTGFTHAGSHAAGIHAASIHPGTGKQRAPEAQHLRTRALEGYERLSALPLPARKRAGALAAAADIRVRHLGAPGLSQARAAVELEPSWAFTHLVRLHCGLCASSRSDAEDSLKGLQSCLDAGEPSTTDSLTELLRRTRLHRELPRWARDLHPAFADFHHLPEEA